MTKANFTQHFQTLVRHLTDTELGYLLGCSADGARKMRHGTVQSLKLQAALRLARELGISPWEVAGETPPRLSKRSPSKGNPSDASPSPAEANPSVSSTEFAELRNEVQQLQTELRETREAIRSLVSELHDRRTHPAPDAPT
jgi:hypothetical protein